VLFPSNDRGAGVPPAAIVGARHGVPYVALAMSSEPNPKRRYTVSEKVLAANRGNLAKANAVPKDYRYRCTARRQQASRENLKKALGARKPAPPPRRRAWNCRSIISAARHAGRKARETFRRQRQRLLEVWQPKDELQAKLAQGAADCLGRWMGLLRDRVERERTGLLRILRTTPRDARSALRLAKRLVGLFQGEAWIEGALDQLELRLKRLARMFYEMRNAPTIFLYHALDQATPQELGNPFQAMQSVRMEEILLKPAGERDVTTLAGRIVLPELPAEKRWESTGSMGVPPASENPNDAAREHTNQEKTENGSVLPSRRPRRPHPATRTAPWPESFEDFHQMVRQCLGAQEDLAPLVERMARLLWKLHRVAEFEYQRVLYGLTPALEHSRPGLSAMEVVETALTELAGPGWRENQATAQQLAVELIDALGELLEQQYAPKPAGGNNAADGATPGSGPTPESTPAPESTPTPPSTPAPESTPQPAPENTSVPEPMPQPESKAVPENTPTLSTHRQSGSGSAALTCGKAQLFRMMRKRDSQNKGFAACRKGVGFPQVRRRSRTELNQASHKFISSPQGTVRTPVCGPRNPPNRPSKAVNLLKTQDRIQLNPPQSHQHAENKLLKLATFI
jgi:hypothetical protein